MRRAVILLIAACSGPAATRAPIADPVPMVEARAPEATPYDRVLAAYEHVRGKLAADELSADAGKALAAAAREAKLAELAGAADKLAAASTIEQQRHEFGETSKHVIALIASHPGLERGHYVFECPMVKGYNKWVQDSQDMANPYMGKAMLACGGESTWK